MCPLLPIRKPLLCYVTDRRSLPGAPEVAGTLLLEKIEQAARAGVDWIQLREKDISARQLSVLAGEALRRVAGASAILINDRLDVACAVNAAGVHLGEHSLPVGEAKRLAIERFLKKDFLAGVSVHSMEAARRAEEDGADYVIFGPIYATPSKAEFGQPQELRKLKEVCERLTIPVLAIGGVTVENVRECFDAGASGIAAIRLFQDATNLRAVVKQLHGESY